MNLIWHIIRKDLVRFRLVLLAWVLLLAGKSLFAAVISGVFGQPSLYWLKLCELPNPLFWVVFAAPGAIAYFLVAALVFEDAPAGRDPFWVTRPISGTQLLAAKFLFAVLMFVVGPLLAVLPWWLACGFGLTEIAPIAGYTGGAYLLVALLGMAVASLTNGYPRYFVWTLAGLAVVLGVHIITPGSVHNNTPLAVVFGILAACVAVLSVEISLHRFIVRHFRKTLPLVAALTLVASACLFKSPPDSLTRLFMPSADAYPGEENVHVTVAGDVRTFLKGGLILPLKVEGLPDNAVPTLWMNATWRAPDGKVWTVKGGSGGSLGEMRRASWQLLQLKRENVPPDTHAVAFAMAPKNADRIATEAASVEGRVRIYIASARLVGETPVAPGTLRFAGGSFTVSDLLVAPGDISFIYTLRASYSWERWRGIGYVALVNHRTGEIIEPSRQDYRNGGPPIFSDVAVACVWLRFKIPDAKWLSESTFAVVGISKGHELNTTVPAYVRPANHAASLLQPPVPVSAEILKQYTGTYRPRTGATLVIKERRDTLELQDSGFFRTALFRESGDHFVAPNQNWIFAGDSGYSADFVRDASGRVTHFIVHENGRDFVVPRMPAPDVAEHVETGAHRVTPELPRKHVAVPVSPDILRQYAGTYQSKEMTWVVTLDGDHLTAHSTNVPVTELFAESETHFFAKAGEAAIEFVKDAKGVVTHIVAHENGHDTIVLRTGPATDEPPAKR